MKLTTINNNFKEVIFIITDINDPRFVPEELKPYVISEIESWHKSNKEEPKLAIVQSVGSGTIKAHYLNETETFDVINPNEVPTELGNHIFVYDAGGSKVIDFRKPLSLDTIYVNSSGLNAYGNDSSGNIYGSMESPFLTPEYALSRLPKNLNNRKITIYLMDVGYGSVVNMGGFHSGTLTISGHAGYSSEFLGMSFEHCTAELVFQNLWSLGGYLDSASIFDFNNCRNVTIKGCDMYVDPSTHHGNYCVTARRSNVRVENCSGSDPDEATRIGTFINASDMSNILCKNNTGGGLNLLYSISENSSLGVLGTEPTAVTRASIDASSVIRP